MYIFISSLVFLYMMGPVYLICKEPKLGDKKIPTPKEVLDKFFAGDFVKDKCMSKHNMDFWDFRESTMVVSPKTYEFVHEYTARSNGSVLWIFSGTMQAQLTYIDWEGVGQIAGGAKDDPRAGRMYILDYQPPPSSDGSIKVEPGSVLTYYSCFEDKDYINENIYITQKQYKMEGDEEKTAKKHLESAKTNLANITFLEKLKTISCY